MTSFNSQEEFLRALEQNPQWREAVRALILSEELLQLPVQFIAFVGRITAFIDQMNAFVSEQRQINAEQKQFNAEQRQFNADMTTFVSEQKQFNADMTTFVSEQKQFNADMTAFVSEQRQFNAEQRQFNADSARRLSRMEGDMRGNYAQNMAFRDVAGIAMDMGFEYVRTIPDEELAHMAQRAVGRIPINELRSFRRADLVIEATDGSDTHYIAVEASYTADRRDTDRAQRNARFLTDFTGRSAHPAVASFRNDDYVNTQIDSGAIYWVSLDDRGPTEPE